MTRHEMFFVRVMCSFFSHSNSFYSILPVSKDDWFNKKYIILYIHFIYYKMTKTHVFSKLNTCPN